MASTPACLPGAISTKRSATGAASTPATRTGMAFARCTSTRSRGSGPCCAPGSARTGGSRRTSCRSISGSFSSCTTHAVAAKPCLARSSPPWSHEADPTPRKPTRAIAICVIMVRRSWMTGGSVEATLELWASSLRTVKERIRPVFRQDRTAAAAGLFLDALLGPERRKTGWMRAEAAGDPGPWRQQALLDRSRWEADALRDLVREYALETLADPDAVLVLDETGFLKQGKASCGVARQYTGSAGKITNCQIGVFAAYVSDKGHAFIDRALYLPRDWTKNPARLRAAHVPEAVEFTTKPRLALDMIERAIAAGVPFGWVAADTVYGTGEEI